MASSKTHDQDHSTVKAFFEENKVLHNSWLNDLHERPELAFEEVQTAKYITQVLDEHCPSLSHYRHFDEAKTCIVAVFEPPNPTLKPILLRGDIDALPMQGAEDGELAPDGLEKHAGCTQFEHCFSPGLRPSHFTSAVDARIPATAGKEARSGAEATTEDRHHGCGHDGHTAGMLVTAHWIEKNQDIVQRKVVILFQPAEESSGPKDISGGQFVVENGLLSTIYPDVHAVYAIHGGPLFPIGTFFVGEGPMMARSGQYKISVKGSGGHAAGAGIGQTEPLLAAAAIVQSGQNILSRRMLPQDMCILAFTIIRNVGAEASNVCPSEVEIVGSLRAFDDTVWDKIRDELDVIATNVAVAYGCEAELVARKGYPVTRNTSDAGKVTRSAAERVQSVEEGLEVHTIGFGLDDFSPAMGSEDFSYLLEQRPGAIASLGLGSNVEMMHTPDTVFPTEALQFAGRYFAEIVLSRDCIDTEPNTKVIGY